MVNNLFAVFRVSLSAVLLFYVNDLVAETSDSASADQSNIISNVDRYFESTRHSFAAGFVSSSDMVVGIKSTPEFEALLEQSILSAEAERREAAIAKRAQSEAKNANAASSRRTLSNQNSVSNTKKNQSSFFVFENITTDSSSQ